MKYNYPLFLSLCCCCCSFVVVVFVVFVLVAAVMLLCCCFHWRRRFCSWCCSCCCNLNVVECWAIMPLHPLELASSVGGPARKRHLSVALSYSWSVLPRDVYVRALCWPQGYIKDSFLLLLLCLLLHLQLTGGLVLVVGCGGMTCETSDWF